MAQLTGRRTAMSTDRFVSATPQSSRQLEHVEEHLAAHYFLAPTVPSPFAGTFDASLDAILEFGRHYPQTLELMDMLRQEVDRKTNWIALLQAVLEKLPQGRQLVEEFLFLVTRTLLPEQIAENRALMCRMYNVKRNLSARVMLRYDMLSEWLKRDHSHYIVVGSKPPPATSRAIGSPPPAGYEATRPTQRPLMPNIWATLIAAPVEGYGWAKVREAMKHHPTGLDRLLLFTDEEVAGWSKMRLIQMAATVVLQWQWLRQNTETLEGMEVHGWEGLEAKVDDNEWVRDSRTRHKDKEMPEK